MKKTLLLAICIFSYLLPLCCLGECYLDLPKPESGQGTNITGIVTAKLTGEPIEGAQVYTKNCRGIQQSVVSNSDGVYEFVDFPKKQGFLYVNAPGFASKRIIVEAKRDLPVMEIDIELMPSSKVFGVVKNSAGQPIVDATVKTFHFTNQPTKTDSNGRYEIDGLDPAFGHYSVHVKSDNYPSKSVSFKPAAAGEATKVDIVLDDGVVIFGTVTDPDGKALTGATVGNTQARCMWNCIKAFADSEGRYEMANVDKGRLILWAIHPLYPPYVENFTIDSNETERQIDIQFEEPKPFYGKVVDKQGNPVEGVSVAIREVKGVSNLSDCRDRKKTDADGRFVIENAPATGKMVLELYSKTTANIMPEIQIADSDDDYVIEIDRAGRIYGCVLAEQTGEPVENFNVKMTFSKSGYKPGYSYSATWNREGHNFNDINGFFDTGKETIPIGACYELTIFADGFDPLTIDPVCVQEICAEPNRTEFWLKPATIISGRIVDANDQSIAEASVRWFSESNRLDSYGEHFDNHDTVVSDGDGRFEFDSIGTGRRGLYITAPGFADYINASLNFPEDVNKISNIVLEKGSEIYGTVLKNGTPVCGAEVKCDLYSRYNLGNMGYIDQGTVTDSNGNYVLADLPSGELRIYVTMPTTAMQRHSAFNNKVNVLPGQRLLLDFGKERKGFTVAGKVTQGKTGLENANISFSYQDSSCSAATDKNGFYKITGLQKGKYHINCFYQKPRSCSSFSCSSGIQEMLQDMQNITIDSNMTLDFNFGTAVVEGNVPAGFGDVKNLRVVLRRYNPHQVYSNDKCSYSTNWEYVHGSSGRPDTAGHFKIKNLKEGKYSAALAGEGRQLAVTGIFEVDQSSESTKITFVPVQSKLTVKAVDKQTKQPIADAKCSLSDDTENSYWGVKKDPNDKMPNSTTDANGVIVYEKLSKGSYRFAASANGYLPVIRKDLKIDPNQVSEIEVAFDKSAIIKFELSEEFKKKITEQSAYLWCKVTNVATGEIYTPPSHNTTYISKWHRVFLVMPEEFKKFFPENPCLNLSAGKYLLEYEVCQSPIDRMSDDQQKPLLTAKTKVDITTGQTTEVSITAD